MITFPFDLVTVSSAYNKGYILDKILHLIASDCATTYGLRHTHYSLINGLKLHGAFPYARSYLFSHYKHFYHLANKIGLEQDTILWYTHFEEKHNISLAELSTLLKCLNTLVLTPCEANKQSLMVNGVDEKQIRVVYGGFSDDYFQAKPISDAYRRVCIVGACYPRKRPELLLQVVSQLPEYHFLLIGPSPDEVDNKDICWSNSAFRQQIAETANLSLLELPYSDYLSHIKSCGIYLMLSRVEGGPIGLLESMAVGLYPVATNTGFTPDLLSMLPQGLLLNQETNATEVITSIATASDYFLKYGSALPKQAVKDMSWQSFSAYASGHIHSYLEKTTNLSLLHIHKKITYMMKADKKLFRITERSLKSYCHNHQFKIEGDNSRSSLIVASVARMALRLCDKNN